METLIQAFKNEIIESEKSRIDLLRWKFIAIGALGSIALKIDPLSSQPGGSKPGGSFSFASTLIFCLIPLVCVYIDLLCKHLNIRILVVGNFFLEHKIEPNSFSPEDTKIVNFYKGYEEFCYILREKEKVKPFALEDLAQEISTIICSFLIIIVAFFSNTSHPANNTVTSLLILIWGVTLLTLIWWFAISILIFLFGSKAQKNHVEEENKKLKSSIENLKTLIYKPEKNSGLKSSIENLEPLIYKVLEKQKTEKQKTVFLKFLVILLPVSLLLIILQNSIISYSSLSLKLISDSALPIAFFGMLGILISILLNKIHYEKKKLIRVTALKQNNK